MFLTSKDNKEVNNNKETVCLILNNHFKPDRYRMHGFTFPIINTLFEDYNVITLGTVNDFKYLEENDLQSIKEITWSPKDHDKFKVGLQRKKTHGEGYRDFNTEKIMEVIDSVIPRDLKISKLILPTSHGFNLPQQSLISKQDNLEFHELKNEFWDYIHEDEENKELIYNFYNSIDVNRTWNCLTFSFGETNMFINFIKRLAEFNPVIDMYMFVSDPLGFYPIFDIDPNINLKTCYFEDDFRGTRKLHNSNLGELTVTFFENYIERDEDLNEKTKDFIFAGNFFVKKSSGRIEDWNKYFKNLDNDKSKFHIPLNTSQFYGVRLGDIKSEKHEATVKAKHGEDLYYDITSHPNFSYGIDLLSLNKEYTKYKYSIILQCMSKYDSLCWRMFHYLYKDIIPFIAEEYDPFCMQIPEQFKEKLVVRSHKDIEDKINYYNENDSERLNLLKELKDYYKIEEHKSEKYARNQIRKLFN
jgi:hypothetical protein